MAKTSYLIGLGSNRYRGGPPRSVIERAITVLADSELDIVRTSSTIISPPLGPGIRHYANAVILVRTDLEPLALLETCQVIEKQFGRRAGRRWGDRTLDLDLLLWSGGSWVGAGLILPHPALADRHFVLAPLAEIAPEWRHPISGRTMRQLFHHVQRNMPVDRSPNRP